ncbi:hypothetical protein EON64_00950 [archaeon]|nr:MAG: hypothetical protein EON64_00950 [archaeon]
MEPPIKKSTQPKLSALLHTTRCVFRNSKANRPLHFNADSLFVVANSPGKKKAVRALTTRHHIAGP